MDIESLRELVGIRRELTESYESEIPGVLDQHWELLTRLLVEDMDSTVAYLSSSEVTADEIVNISEVFTDVVRLVPSREFIAAARTAANRFPKACADYNILGHLELAEKMVERRVLDPVRS